MSEFTRSKDEPNRIKVANRLQLIGNLIYKEHLREKSETVA